MLLGPSMDTFCLVTFEVFSTNLTQTYVVRTYNYPTHSHVQSTVRRCGSKSGLSLSDISGGCR